MDDELKHFLLVVEHGTFTEAARRARLTQPALSASIQRLEEQFGTRLLERGRKGAEPTAAGQALVPYARQVFAALDDARRAVGETAGVQRGEVRLGAGATVCTYLLPERIKRFRERFPAIKVRLREATSAELLDAVSEGTLDLAIVASDEGSGEHWQDDALILVAAPGVDAKKAPFITFPRGASTRTMLDRHFPGAEVVMELSSIATVKGHVRAGVGIALLSRAAVGTDLTLGRLVAVPDARTPIVRAWRIAHRGVERLAPAPAALRRLLFEDTPTSPRRKSR